MDDLGQIWLWYAERRLGRASSVEDVEFLSPKEAKGLLEDFSCLFEPHLDVIRGSAPDQTARVDDALCRLAKDDSFEGWQDISGAVWRALFDRHKKVMIAIEIADRKQDKILARLPRGLDHRSRMRTLWLQRMLSPTMTMRL